VQSDGAVRGEVFRACIGADFSANLALRHPGSVQTSVRPGEGKRLNQRRRFLALGDEQLDKVRLEREQLLGDPLDLGRVVLVLKQ